jgi:hypothetical protein
VIFVLAKGVGTWFVSKKINAKKKMTKIKIDYKKAACYLSKQIGGNLWLKKNGESRLYIGKGYLRFAVETDSSAQIQYYLKTYDRTDTIKNAVEQFNLKFQIVASDTVSEAENQSDTVSEAENQVYPGYGI